MNSNKHPETHYAFHGGTEPVVLQPKTLPKIGIYAGSFDPVHVGHIVFALKSQKVAGLSQVYFVPERRPERNDEPEHYVHRSAMLKTALKPYRQFSLFELPDARLNARSVSRLLSTMPPADYSLLTTAADLLWHQGELPALYYRYQLVVAVTSHQQMTEVLCKITSGERVLRNITFVDISTEHVSSSVVRKSLRRGERVRGILPSVWRYARKQWLYLPPVYRKHVSENKLD